MDSQQKANYLISQAKSLEEQVEARDEITQHQNDRYKGSKMANDMLIDAIQAKITILDEL